MLGKWKEEDGSPLQSVFFALRDKEKADYTELDLKCLKSCDFPNPPLMYLMERAHTEEAYGQVKDALVPHATGLQADALTKIQKRIAKSKATER